MGSAAVVARAVENLNPFQRAYLDMLTALAVWRVAQDCEAQVSHWVIEGVASHPDLLAARERTRKAHRTYTSARARYTRLSTLVAVRAGTVAGSRAATAAAYPGTH